MLYPHAPFTQKIRAEIRRAISSHPKWRAYRKFSPHNVPQLNAMTRDQLFAACDALGLNVPALIERSGARTGQRYRTGVSNAEFDKRTDAVIFLESLGYVYAGEKWQKKPEW